MSGLRPTRWDAVIVAAIAAILVASVGASLTDLGPWYQDLREPSWKPPDAAFGPIWTVIFALAVLSSVSAWRNDPTTSGRQWIVGLFAANGLLNILWSLIFFQIKRPDLALIEVGALWLSVLVLIIVLYGRSRRASALLLPYLVWVSIAAALNYEVVVLNRPFS